LIYDIFYRVSTCGIEKYEEISQKGFGPHKKKDRGSWSEFAGAKYHKDERE